MARQILAWGWCKLRVVSVGRRSICIPVVEAHRLAQNWVGRVRRLAGDGLQLILRRGRQISLLLDCEYLAVHSARALLTPFLPSSESLDIEQLQDT